MSTLTGSLIDPDHQLAVFVFDDFVRKKIRLLFAHRGDIRAVVWMMVGSDGSLYLNPRTVRKGPVITGRGTADGFGGFTELEWQELERLEGQDSKVSYHASGIVKGANLFVQSTEVRNLAESTLIRQDMYSNPERFAVVRASQFRKTDVLVQTWGGQPFEFDDNRPLACRVFAAPLKSGNAMVTVLDDVDGHQTALLFPFKRLENCQDLTYELVFFQGVEGQWPKQTFQSITMDL